MPTTRLTKLIEYMTLELMKEPISTYGTKVKCRLFVRRILNYVEKERFIQKSL